MGVTLIVGCPGSGKTTLAVRIASELTARKGWPILAIDPARVEQFAKFPRIEAPSDPASPINPVREVIRRVWQNRSHTVYTPRNEAEFDILMRAAQGGGETTLLIDEFRFYANAHYLSMPLTIACRLWRHARLEIIATTQHVGDLHAELFAVATRVIVFRTTSPRGLKRLETEFGLDRVDVSTLPKYEYLEAEIGFDDGKKKAAHRPGVDLASEANGARTGSGDPGGRPNPAGNNPIPLGGDAPGSPPKK